MTAYQWQQILQTLTGSFPTMADALTEEQTRAWQEAMADIIRKCEAEGLQGIERIQNAIFRWYQKGDGTWPTIQRIEMMAAPQRKPTGTYQRLPALSEEDKAAHVQGLARARQLCECRTGAERWNLLHEWYGVSPNYEPSNEPNEWSVSPSSEESAA